MASLSRPMDLRHRLLEWVFPECLIAFLDHHGTISTRHGLIIGGREVGVIRSSRGWPNDDGACQLLCRAARLLNGVGRLLCNAARTSDLSH